MAAGSARRRGRLCFKIIIEMVWFRTTLSPRPAFACSSVGELGRPYWMWGFVFIVYVEQVALHEHASGFLIIKGANVRQEVGSYKRNRENGDYE